MSSDSTHNKRDMLNFFTPPIDPMALQRVQKSAIEGAAAVSHVPKPVPDAAQPTCTYCKAKLVPMKPCLCGYTFTCIKCFYFRQKNKPCPRHQGLCQRVEMIRTYIDIVYRDLEDSLGMPPEKVSFRSRVFEREQGLKWRFLSTYIAPRYSQIDCWREIGTGPAMRQACIEEFELLKHGMRVPSSAKLYFDLLMYHEDGEIMCHLLIETMSLTHYRVTSPKSTTPTSDLHHCRMFIRGISEAWEMSEVSELDFGYNEEPPEDRSPAILQQLSIQGTPILGLPVTRGFRTQDAPGWPHESAILIAQLLIKMRSIATLQNLRNAHILSGILPPELINEVRAQMLQGMLADEGLMVLTVRCGKDLATYIDLLYVHCDILCETHGEIQQTLARLVGINEGTRRYNCDRSPLYQSIARAAKATPMVIPVLREICRRRAKLPSRRPDNMAMTDMEWSMAVFSYGVQRELFAANFSPLWKV